MLRKHLSYANVAATLALVLAMSGTVYAISVPRNSVDTRHLRKGAVTTPKLARGAVTSKKVRNSSLTLSDLGGTGSVQRDTTTSSPITLGPGQCRAQLTGNFGDGVVGDMVVGTLTDANGEAVLPNDAAFIPSIVIKTTQGGAVPNLVVCNTGGGTHTIPTGSVFHWRLIERP